MQTFFEDYLNILQACHTDILKALDGLSPDALDWISGPEMNSISVMVFHLTGAERYWIGDVAAQEPSDRDRASLTLRVRPFSSFPFRPSIADWASALPAISTNPNPFDLPSYMSLIILADST